VLLAIGRVPNTSDLGLDRAGVATDERGYIVVDDQLQTNVPGIWALGDCNGRGAFTHTSYNDYEIVADNLFNADHRRVSDRIQAYALYVDPPLGRCGMTDAEIRKSGRRALIAKYPMSKVSRASEKGETQGFIKICVDAETKQILGAAILGVGGDEVIHVLLDVMYAKGSIHGHSARDAHSPDGRGISSDYPRQTGAVCVGIFLHHAACCERNAEAEIGVRCDHQCGPCRSANRRRKWFDFDDDKGWTQRGNSEPCCRIRKRWHSL
jgi:hypothetical protein